MQKEVVQGLVRKEYLLEVQRDHLDKVQQKDITLAAVQKRQVDLHLQGVVIQGLRHQDLHQENLTRGARDLVTVTLGLRVDHQADLLRQDLAVQDLAQVLEVLVQEVQVEVLLLEKKDKHNK